MSIEPVDPSKKTGGDGQEKYPAKPKHGPGEFDKILEKEKADLAREQVRKMAETTRSEPKYTGKAYSETGPTVGPRTSGGFGGGGSGGDTKFLKPKYKAGGKVSEVSHKKALEKAGFYSKDKTKSEREKIVSKVTTKPQRLGMVEKLFSAKKMKSGGTASARADGCAIRGKTRA